MPCSRGGLPESCDERPPPLLYLVCEEKPMLRSRVAVIKTDVSTVLDDYVRLARLAGMDTVLSRDLPTLVKLNLSWTKYFPSCSSEPWQVEGALRALLDLGYR